MTTMNAYILNEALKATAERSGTHGDAEDQFHHVAAMWTAYLGVYVSASDVCQCMAMLKMSRAKIGNPVEPDHYIDQAGYSSLAGRVAMATVATEEIRRRVMNMDDGSSNE